MNVLIEEIGTRLEVLRESSAQNGRFRFRGTALVQGSLSRNDRFYPAEVVAEAVAQAQGQTLTVYARHGEALNGTGLPVGRVDRLYLEGRDVRYEASLAPTRQGRDVQALIEGGFVTGVSIRAFPYTSRRVPLRGREVEWIESLTLRGIDFTDDPGITQAAGIKILEEALRREGGEETHMQLEELTLDALRAGRPDLADAIAAEAARDAHSLLEEARSLLDVAGDAAILPALRGLVALRARQEIADYVSAQLANDPLRELIARRLVEECATLADAQARLPREREYLAALRRVSTAAPAGKGLVDNTETGGAAPEQARARALAGLG